MESIARNIERILWLTLCLFDYFLKTLRGAAYVLMAALFYSCFSPPPHAADAITLAGVIATVNIVFPIVAAFVFVGGVFGWWRIGPDAPPLLFWRRP